MTMTASCNHSAGEPAYYNQAVRTVSQGSIIPAKLVGDWPTQYLAPDYSTHYYWYPVTFYLYYDYWKLQELEDRIKKLEATVKVLILRKKFENANRS